MKRAIYAPDWHYPLIHKPTVAALMDYLGRNKVDIFVYGGDQHDNAEISHHNKSKPLYKPPGAFVKNTDGFKKEILVPVEAAVGKDCEMVWIDGNHEDWTRQMIEEHPELDGLFDRVIAYDLLGRGYTVIPLGHAYVHGKLSFIHGEWLTGTGNQAGSFPAKKLVEITATNTLAGHTHTAQSFTRISPVSQSEKWMGWISPILGQTNPAYLRNRPTSWLNGFTIVEFQDNGCFNVYPVIVIEGRFIFGGEEYGGSRNTSKGLKGRRKVRRGQVKIRSTSSVTVKRRKLGTDIRRKKVR